MRVQAVGFFAGSLPMVVEEGSIVEISPARFRLSPDADPEAVGAVVGRAKVVQFDSPLPHRLLDALAQALSEHPETELYIYGHYGLEIDNHLSFLNGFEQIGALSLNLHGLKALDGLARFDCLRQLTLQRMPSIPRLEPLEDLGGLEDLVLSGAVRDVAALSSLTSLRRIRAPAAQAILDALTGHPQLERVELAFGAGTRLESLATLPKLRDLSIWQVNKLDSNALVSLAGTTGIQALALGALRHVTSLDFLQSLTATLRYLEVEKLPNLATLEPLGDLAELHSLGLFDSRPADRTLRPLLELQGLRDLTILDTYPADHVEELFTQLSHTRLQIRLRTTAQPSRIRWRGLLSYVDKVRERSAN